MSAGAASSSERPHEAGLGGVIQKYDERPTESLLAHRKKHPTDRVFFNLNLSYQIQVTTFQCIVTWVPFCRTDLATMCANKLCRLQFTQQLLT